VKLIPFSPEHLRLNHALPFGVRGACGRLLLAAGGVVGNAERLAWLCSVPLYADEDESSEWRRRWVGAMDAMLRQNAPLKSVAEARPQDSARDAAAMAEASLPDQWESLAQLLDAALREAQPQADWLVRVRTLHERASKLGQRRPDASLYHLIQGAQHSLDKYSCHHALLAMLVCEQAAPLLGWDAQATCSLACAALTMNLAMAGLQDVLASSDLQPTPAMREQIRGHAQAGASLLHQAGADDTLWCETVRLHHEPGDARLALADLPQARQLARLLRRVDIFTAKISRRRARAPMSPVQAAREACLGAGGVPDEVGGALLRATGLYPPGSFVELVNGERGIVVARGRRANLPWVASLVAPSGLALGEPALRDTIEARFAVRAALASSAVKVRPDHERILALR
jgi:HD-GYP domain-containing protein (c-di-GMP phosphodiesterase class II)